MFSHSKVADPVFHCRLCPPCKHGELNHCLAGETFAVGGSLSGSWSTSFSCPTSNLFVVPDNVSDRSAVLVEPLAVGLHAALRIGPQVLEKNLFVVIGAGAIGLLQVAALRHLSPNSTIVTVARYSFQREAAKRIGSHHVVAGSEELLPLLAQLSNATIIKQKSSFLKKIGSDDVLLVIE
jgi:threonine dehydrogenase-like Zn-dependent dehydrogenase